MDRLKMYRPDLAEGNIDKAAERSTGGLSAWLAPGTPGRQCQLPDCQDPPAGPARSPSTPISDRAGENSGARSSAR